jgi:phosphoribosylglycinamide formyltransferase
MQLVLQAVVSDVPSCGGVTYAQEHGIATLTFPASKKGMFPGLSKEELVQQLTEVHAVDFVLLAGFLKVRLDKGVNRGGR